MTKVLFATQGVGILFAAVFLGAYLGGLPSTNVLHNQPVFRSSLAIIGAALLILVLATVILSVYNKRKINPSV
jgi:type IV secretory pathway TrbL component